MRAISEESWVQYFEELYGKTDTEEYDDQRINKEQEDKVTTISKEQGKHRGPL